MIEYQVLWSYIFQYHPKKKAKSSTVTTIRQPELLTKGEDMFQQSCHKPAMSGQRTGSTGADFHTDMIYYNWTEQKQNNTEGHSQIMSKSV